METSTETATSVLPAVKTRVRHGIKNEDFVRAYQSSSSCKECAEKLGTNVGVVTSKSSYLRKLGIQLKSFGHKKLRIDVAGLNALIAAAPVATESK